MREGSQCCPSFAWCCGSSHSHASALDTFMLCLSFRSPRRHRRPAFFRHREAPSYVKFAEIPSPTPPPERRPHAGVSASRFSAAVVSAASRSAMRSWIQTRLCSARACYIQQILRRNQAPTIPFIVSAFRTAFPPPSLLKYTNTSRPMPCHSLTRSAHQRRSSWL